MRTSLKNKFRNGGRILLGSFLVVTGIAHLTFARKAFKAQVPNWVPAEKDATVVASGYAEIAVGLALLLGPEKFRPMIGKVAAGFFGAVLPGNVAQWTHRRNAFGLDTDDKRFGRLFLQPLLVWAAIETTKK